MVVGSWGLVRSQSVVFSRVGDLWTLVLWDFLGAGFICHLMTLCFGANCEVGVGQLVMGRSLFATCSRDECSFLTEVGSWRLQLFLSRKGRDTRVPTVQFNEA